MAGKAPLLLAMVLFVIGVSGLALSSAERAQWGPFEASAPVAAAQLRVVDSGTPYAAPSLDELFTTQLPTAIADAPAPQPTAAETAAPEPTLVPLRVYGISSDDGGVSAAAAVATPPPVTIVNVATDGDGVVDSETPAPLQPNGEATPEPTVPGDQLAQPPAADPHSATSTPEPTATATPEPSATPSASPTPDATAEATATPE